MRERSALMGLLRSCFARAQAWLPAGKYLNALVCELPSRNGWSVAEHAGDGSPGKAQRLLSRAPARVQPLRRRRIGRLRRRLMAMPLARRAG